MVVIRTISARIGRTTSLGIAGNIRRLYPKWLYGIIAALTFANVCNIGADLGAIAETGRLLIPSVSSWVLLALFAIVCAGGQIFMQHRRYVIILKWLTLSLFAYFAVLCIVQVDWTQLLLGLIWPRFSLDRRFWLMVAAILGTTISPYLFFWQAAQEVEDTETEPIRKPLVQRPAQGASELPDLLHSLFSP